MFKNKPFQINIIFADYKQKQDNMLKNKNPLMNTERLLAFSDGVFAIAITILVLEIKLPKHEDLMPPHGLYNYLCHLWPSYLSYVLSFFVIGVYWSNHHWLFTFVTKTNHVLNMLHIWFLMGISFMPFTTAILGEFILFDEYKNAAVTACCIGFLLPVPPLFILYLYATHNNRLTEINLNKQFINNQKYKLIAGLVFSTLALCFSFNYPNVSLTIIGISMATFLLPPASPVYDSIEKE